MTKEEMNKDLQIELLKKDVSFKDKEIDKIEQIIKLLEEENKRLKATNDFVTDEYNKTGNENFELANRIDKAIDFIKENADYSGISFCSDLRYDECLELLEILKGE